VAGEGETGGPALSGEGFQRGRCGEGDRGNGEREAARAAPGGGEGSEELATGDAPTVAGTGRDEGGDHRRREEHARATAEFGEVTEGAVVVALGDERGTGRGGEAADVAEAEADSGGVGSRQSAVGRRGSP